MENTLGQIIKRQARKQARLEEVVNQCEADLEAIQALARMTGGMKEELSWLNLDQEKSLTVALFTADQYDETISTAMSALAYRAQQSLDRLVKIAEELEQEGES